MRKLVFTEIGDFEKKTLGKLEMWQVPKSIPGDEEVLIKVAYCGICGSDGQTLRGNLGPHTEEVRKYLLPMGVGHELSGVIEDAGPVAQAAGFKPGNRVTGNYFRPCGSCYYCSTGRENFCQHPVNKLEGMADYITWHMSQVYHIPDNVSLRDAAMTEPMSIAFSAVEMAKVKMGSRVAVFGGGGIGQMAAQLAKHAGASVVTMFEPVEEKRQMALDLGADNAFDSVHEDVKAIAEQVTGGLGYDCVIEASGAAAAAKSVVDILSVDGDAVFFSMYPEDYDLPVNLFKELYMEQKHLHGMSTSSGIWPRVISSLNTIEIAPLIQKEYDLDDYQEAFDAHMSAKYAKVMIHCNKDLI